MVHAITLALCVLCIAPRASAQHDAGALAAPSARSPAQRLADARARIERGDLAGAEPTALELSRSDDPRVAGMAWFARASIAERRFDFATALEAYRTSVARDAGGPYAARALARTEYLAGHAEGDFAPLAALQRVRTSAAMASDATALATLARQVETFPPGPVRAEARLLLGQAYLGRMHRPDVAAPILRALAEDRAAAADLRHVAIELLTQLHEQRGDLDQALRDLRRLGGPERTVARVRQQLRRAAGFRIAWVLLGVVIAAGAVSVVRVARAGQLRTLRAAWTRPLPLAHLAMLSLGGALLAHSYEDHDMRPFFGFGAGALVVYLAASAWSLSGSERVAWRVVRAITCAGAMLAVSFLAMHRFDQGMLEGIGL